MLHGSHRLMPPCNFFDCSMPQLRSRTNDFSISRNLWLMWTSSMPPKKQTKARQFSVLHLSQISLTKNFEGGILAQFHRMSPRGDSPKRLLCRNSTVQRHLWTGPVYCQPPSKIKEIAALAGEYNRNPAGRMAICPGAWSLFGSFTQRFSIANFTNNMQGLLCDSPNRVRRHQGRPN